MEKPLPQREHTSLSCPGPTRSQRRMKFALYDRLGTEGCRLQFNFTRAKSRFESLQTGALGARASKIEDSNSLLLENIGDLRHQKGRGTKSHSLGRRSGGLIICAL